MKANMAKLRDDNPSAAAQREALRRAIAFKSYEFDRHGVEMNQRYESSGGPTARPSRNGRATRFIAFRAFGASDTAKADLTKALQQAPGKPFSAATAEVGGGNSRLPDW